MPLEGIAADIGVSDVFASSCPGFGRSDIESLSVRDAYGPIQSMTFAVPSNSKYTSISAEAAYFVFGFGARGGLRDATTGHPVWYDEAAILQRNAGSGTQAMIAAAIGVASERWKGMQHRTSDEVAAGLQAAGATQELADKTLGILASDYIEIRNLRAQVRVLAFQDSNQSCAVYPDSTPTARDKVNVRDGHYAIWGPLHFLYKVNEDGLPINPTSRQRVLDILGYLSATKALPNGVQFIDLYAQSGLVPQCAMRVVRKGDGGKIEPYAPTSSCSCRFDAQATGSTTCVPCKVQGNCAGKETCSFGYCEPE
jgi:hypothetical protein